MSDKPSIKTIAQALGITAAAVSKALNDKPDIGAALKERVRAEAVRQGFVPNRSARQLATGSSRTLGVYLLNRFGRTVREYFGYHLLDGLLARAQEADFDLVLLQDCDAEGLPLDWVGHARQRGVAGLVVFGLDSTSGQGTEFAGCGMPVVAVDTPAPGLSLVSSDQRSGMAAAVRHLRELGHQRIGYIGLRGAGWVAGERLAGFRDGLGGADGPDLAAVLDLAGGQRAADELLDAHPGLTALACATDLQAYGALAALRRRGLRVPEDISLTGFDDLLASALLEPALTTVAQDPAALGWRAADGLLALIAGDRLAKRIFVPTKLVVRGSTGPARPD